MLKIILDNMLNSVHSVIQRNEYFGIFRWQDVFLEL